MPRLLVAGPLVIPEFVLGFAWSQAYGPRGPVRSPDRPDPARVVRPGRHHRRAHRLRPAAGLPGRHRRARGARRPGPGTGGARGRGERLDRAAHGHAAAAADPVARRRRAGLRHRGGQLRRAPGARHAGRLRHPVDADLHRPGPDGRPGRLHRTRRAGPRHGGARAARPGPAGPVAGPAAARRPAPDASRHHRAQDRRRSNRHGHRLGLCPGRRRDSDADADPDRADPRPGPGPGARELDPGQLPRRLLRRGGRRPGPQRRARAGRRDRRARSGRAGGGPGSRPLAWPAGHRGHAGLRPPGFGARGRRSSSATAAGWTASR